MRYLQRRVVLLLLRFAGTKRTSCTIAATGGPSSNARSGRRRLDTPTANGVRGDERQRVG